MSWTCEKGKVIRERKREREREREKERKKNTVKDKENEAGIRER